MSSPPRCIVVGGSGALGESVCRLLGERDAAIAFTYHTGREAAERIAREVPGSRAYPLDVGDPAAVRHTIAEAAADLHGLDSLIYCAAIAVTGPRDAASVHETLPEITEEGWRRMMAVNAGGAFFAVQAAAERLKESGGGNLVLIGSIDGVKLVPSPIHYAASKGALFGMAQAAAKELGEFNIRVNLIAPGLMETGLSRVVPQDLLAEFRKHSALGRLGRPQEIAALAVHLALDNTYLTGQAVVVDGGL